MGLEGVVAKARLASTTIRGEVAGDRGCDRLAAGVVVATSSTEGGCRCAIPRLCVDGKAATSTPKTNRSTRTVPLAPGHGPHLGYRAFIDKALGTIPRFR